ncbi:MAG: hypothetical protein MH472_03180 [Bacteroidia bacterium]|nr:hypothetical protein [Bacteroidia bacterium]
MFKLKNDSIIRLDKSVFHGGNFDRFLFTYNNKIHLIGGYGLFNTNNNIEVFNFKTREWGITATKGEKPNFIRGICLKQGNNIFSFFNSKNGNDAEEDILDNNIYKLDLETKVWEKYENINLHTPIIFHRIYTQDYTLAVLLNSVIIFKNKTAEFILVPREELRFNMDILFKYDIDKNIIHFENYVSTTLKTNQSINLDQLWDSHAINKIKFVLNPSWYQNKRTKIFIGILIIILLIFGIYFLIKKFKILNQNPAKNWTGIKNPYSEKILASNKNSIDIDELDFILGIDHMEFDSKKLKRSRILNEIEKSNPGLIQRRKDQFDKRKFIYLIKK